MPRSKKPKEYYWRIRVPSRESSAVFDMLRYDGGKVAGYFHSTQSEDGITYSEGYDNLIICSDRPPTIARWKSFGIAVIGTGNTPWPEDILRPGYGDPYFQTSRYSVG